jgi:glycosyltransferase involved in cell wall biosynthesis
MSGKLRVGIDARVLAEPTPKGVSRYLTALLRAAAAEEPAHEYRLYLRERSLTEDPFTALPFSQHVVGSLPGLRSHLAWQQVQLPWQVRRDNVDVLVSPYYSGALFCSVPQVIGVCDVSFELFPHEFPSWLSFKPKLLARPTCQRAARVFTISQFSRDEIIRLYHLPAEKVVVIPAGSEEHYWPRTRPTIRTETEFEDMPFFLWVGSFLPRRQIPAVLQALAQLPPHFHLCVVGEQNEQKLAPLKAEAQRLQIAARVHCLGHISDDDLERLYAKAIALVVPSTYEGFGLPVLEAMHAGLPVIAWDIPVFREVAGDAVILLPVGDSAALATTMAWIASDEAERQRLIAKGRRRATAFSWRHAARIFLEMLHSVVCNRDLVTP